MKSEHFSRKERGSKMKAGSVILDRSIPTFNCRIIPIKILFGASSNFSSYSGSSPTTTSSPAWSAADMEIQPLRTGREKIANTFGPPVISELSNGYRETPADRKLPPTGRRSNGQRTLNVRLRTWLARVSSIATSGLRTSTLVQSDSERMSERFQVST